MEKTFSVLLPLFLPILIPQVVYEVEKKKKDVKGRDNDTNTTTTKIKGDQFSWVPPLTSTESGQSRQSRCVHAGSETASWGKLSRRDFAIKFKKSCIIQ